MKLIYKNKIILKNPKYETNIFKLAYGLMFASKEKIKDGLIMTYRINLKHPITMLFCFYKYDILFVDKNFVVVDKVTLKPFQLNYIPKKKCLYVIESCENKFKEIKIFDKIKITL